MSKTDPKQNIIHKGNTIGKFFLGGYLTGKCIECFSAKKTSYDKFLGMKMAVASIPIAIATAGVASKIKKCFKMTK